MKRICRRSVAFVTSLIVCAMLPLVVPARAQEKAESSDVKSDGKSESLRAKQQALFDKLNVAEAWEITKGDPQVVVGVIDNGFDFFHPHLKGQVTPGFYYPSGYHAEFYENMAHGTLVVSLIVAKESNPTGMVGLAPRCQVLTASQGTIEHTLLKL